MLLSRQYSLSRYLHWRMKNVMREYHHKITPAIFRTHIGFLCQLAYRYTDCAGRQTEQAS
jgi:hypothetical protein